MQPLLPDLRTAFEASFSAPEIMYRGVSRDLKQLSEVAIQQTADYPAALTNPLEYPGKRPEHSFVVRADHVLPVEVTKEGGTVQFGIRDEEGVWDVDDFLRDQGVLPMSARIPVVGFGSNASPGQLREKYKLDNPRLDPLSNPKDHDIIPTVFGEIKDLAAAFSTKMGVRGYMFGELVEAMGVTTEVVVNFLTPEQFERMQKTETKYELCENGTVHIDGLESNIPAYMYLGKNEAILDANGKPILMSVATTAAEGYTAMTEEELLQLFVTEYGDVLAATYSKLPYAVETAEQFAGLMARRKDFIVRPNTDGTIYKFNPEEGQAAEPLLSDFLKARIQASGRVAASHLLENISEENKRIKPKTFSELYTVK